MVDDERAQASHGNECERIVLAIPLERASTFSPRRTRSAVVTWLLFLVAIVAVGVVARLPDEERASNPVAEAAATRDAGVGLTPTSSTAPPTAVTSGGPAELPLAAPTSRHTFGEDGPVGGTAFGDNVPTLSQADIERDGYRHYQQLIARDPSVRRQGPS